MPPHVNMRVSARICAIGLERILRHNSHPHLTTHLLAPCCCCRRARPRTLSSCLSSPSQLLLDSLRIQHPSLQVCEHPSYALGMHVYTGVDARQAYFHFCAVTAGAEAWCVARSRDGYMDDAITCLWFIIRRYWH